MECSRSGSKRADSSSISLPQETRKRASNNLALPLKQIETEGKNKKTKLSRRKGIVKIRAEISEKEMNKTNSKDQ